MYLSKNFKISWPLFIDGVQLSQGYGAIMRRQYSFYHLVPRSSWYSFNQHWKAEPPSGFEQGTSVLNPGPFCHIGKMTIVPEGNPKSCVVTSTWLRECPHLIEKGKTEGEYNCDKTCPHYNTFKLCSYAIATAKANTDLKVLLQFYAK